MARHHCLITVSPLFCLLLPMVYSVYFYLLYSDLSEFFHHPLSWPPPNRVALHLVASPRPIGRPHSSIYLTSLISSAMFCSFQCFTVSCLLGLFGFYNPFKILKILLACRPNQNKLWVGFGLWAIVCCIVVEKTASKNLNDMPLKPLW